MSWTKAVWTNGKKKVKGEWTYNWSSDTFTIKLDGKDEITGRERIFTTSNDVPEWGKWTRVGKS